MNLLVIEWPVLGGLGSLCWELAELAGSHAEADGALVVCGGRFQVALSFPAVGDSRSSTAKGSYLPAFVKNKRRGAHG